MRAFVLVDTNTSTGIQYIGVVTLYSGVFVLVDTNTNTGIQLASILVASLYVKLYTGTQRTFQPRPRGWMLIVLNLSCLAFVLA